MASQVKTSTAVSNNNSIGTAEWSGPGGLPSHTDISSNDSSSVSVVTSGTSQYLQAREFLFDIPTNATIQGILLSFTRLGAGSTPPSDNIIRLMKGRTISGDNKAKAGAWPTVETYENYGGATDLWGLTWLPSNINASDFGVVISVSNGSGFLTPSATINHLTLTVYYSVPIILDSGLSRISLKQSMSSLLLQEIL